MGVFGDRDIESSRSHQGSWTAAWTGSGTGACVQEVVDGKKGLIRPAAVAKTQKPPAHPRVLGHGQGATIAPPPPSRVTCYPRTLDDKFFGSLWKGVYWQMALARAAGLQPFFRETHHFHIFQGIKRTWKHFRACLGNVPYCIVPSSGCPPPALRGGGSHTPFHSGIWAEGDRFFLVSVSVLRCVLCPNRVTLTRPQEISCH
jgi:hypothetical protein